MLRSRLSYILLIVLAFLVVVVVAFKVGQMTGRTSEDQGESIVFRTQAMLAFAHYSSYERIRGFLERKCYEAALTDAIQTRNLQMKLLAENLKRIGGRDQELLEYIRDRNPQLLKEIEAGRIPELQSYTTTCL